MNLTFLLTRRNVTALPVHNCPCLGWHGPLTSLISETNHQFVCFFFLKPATPPTFSPDFFLSLEQNLTPLIQFAKSKSQQQIKSTQILWFHPPLPATQRASGALVFSFFGGSTLLQDLSFHGEGFSTLLRSFGGSTLHLGACSPQQRVCDSSCSEHLQFPLRHPYHAPVHLSGFFTACEAPGKWAPCLTEHLLSSKPNSMPGMRNLCSNNSLSD